MNNKKVQTVLKDALEREIPSTQIRLWPAIQAGFASGKHSLFRQGEKMNRTKLPHWQRAVFAALTAASLLAVAFLTPQGRAFAQQVLQFFTRTESDTFYMPPSDLTFEDTTPFHEECGTAIAPMCSVEQIRSKVDFEIKELGILPEALYFVGATGGPDFVELNYSYPERLDGGLSVSVEATGRPSDIGTGIAAKSAVVEQVQIGGLPGEYFTGALYSDEEGNVTWRPDEPIVTLRWEDGGSTYTIFYFFHKYPLSREELVHLAESMTTEPVSR